MEAARAEGFNEEGVFVAIRASYYIGWMVGQRPGQKG